MIDHAGERGFCAGGDNRVLYDSAGEGGAGAREFFFTEYRLNELLFRYEKPVAAFIDGVIMGGGVGISMPAKFRIGTERTTFVMSETGIDLSPQRRRRLAPVAQARQLGHVVGPDWCAHPGGRLRMDRSLRPEQLAV